MITEKEYLEAQQIVDRYKEQLNKGDVMPSLPEWKLNTFVKINGEAFSCQECGSNMFSKSLKGDMKYKCQGCGEIYQGQ